MERSELVAQSAEFQIPTARRCPPAGEGRNQVTTPRATQIPRLFMSAPHLNSFATGLGAEEAAIAADATTRELVFGPCLFDVLSAFRLRHLRCDALINAGRDVACPRRPEDAAALQLNNGAA